MSVIFQTVPPKVNVHLLPKGAKFFSYKVEDSLKINAWMPDNYKEIHQDIEMDSDGFYNEFCEECHRNCYSFLSNLKDEDDDIDWTDVSGGEDNHCWVYEEGYTGQECPEGNNAEDVSIHMNVADMVFQVNLSFRNGRFRTYLSLDSDKAYLRSGYTLDNKIYATRLLMASNVFGDAYEVGGICWGSNNAPTNLRSVVQTYFNSDFNNDLLPLGTFETNCDTLRYLKNSDEFSLLESEHFLCDGEDIDSLILVHAEYDVPAFFTLLSAGYKPLEDSPHIMIIPAKEVQIEKNGSTYYGYETVPDAVNRKWFVSRDENYLVGQI